MKQNREMIQLVVCYRTKINEKIWLEKRNIGRRERVEKQLEIFLRFVISLKSYNFSMNYTSYSRVEWRKKEFMKDFRDLGF